MSVEIIRVDTIDGLWQIIKNSKYDENIKRKRSRYLYRGISDADFKLTTSLARNCKGQSARLEKSILRNFEKYVAISEPYINGSLWKQMVVGQHHGLPTRLMDWTYSPLIAMHFSTSGILMDHFEDKDCAIWEIDIVEINKLLPTEYAAHLNKHSAFLFTLEILQQENISLDKYDKDMGADSLIFIEPPTIDQRIMNQFAYFAVIPQQMPDIETFLDRYTNNSRKYIISKDIKWEMREMLDKLNTNERIVYPGVDGLCKWLSRHYYVTE
ncbi:MAG: FRG domain-containing protein [Butyrivibrio sp.]|nr:FRG domain-containing protein [Butyrivibrio sp.]